MQAAGPYAARGLALLKLEPHLHTLHSDGKDSVAAMFEACRSAGYDAVALTDHNTLSGVPEAAEVAHRLGLILVPGVEVTTFRGHAVALGIHHVPEWRDLEARGMDALAAEIRAEGGVLSVAHAAALGSPICSGCGWDWPIEPASIDLWEIFNSPGVEVELDLAMWQQLLERGGRIAPAAAGDVHSKAAAARQRPAIHVYARERSVAGVLEALRQRRVVASAGAPIEFWLEHDGSPAIALLGEQVTGERWIPRTAGATEVATVEVGDGERRATYALRRGAKGQLEAVSAPIWINTSH